MLVLHKHELHGSEITRFWQIYTVHATLTTNLIRTVFYFENCKQRL